MIKFLQYIRWLSLGIPTGAICVLALIAKELNTSIPWTIYIALFSAVWFIYLRDHWSDARNHPTTIPRRKFHNRFGHVLLWCMGISLIAGSVSTLLVAPPILRKQVFFSGLLVSVFCGGYLLSTQWLGRKRLKELSIAICYSIGICLVPVIMMGIEAMFLITIQTFLLALLNLITFSIYELNEDKEEGFYSITTELGEKKSKIIAYLIIILLSASLVINEPWGAFSGFISTGILIYSLMYVLPTFFAQGDRFRIWGDAVFLFAALFYLF